MTTAIPRALVADALGLPPHTDALPPGDLPAERLAERYLAYLAAEDPDPEAPDAWTGMVMDRLVAEDPERALGVLLAGAGGPNAPWLGDPLRDLADAHPALRARIEAAAEEDPALAAALAG